MAVIDERKPHAASRSLLRPNGQVELLAPLRAMDAGYGSRQPGRDDPHAVRIAARADRRRRRRALADSLVGRLVDLRV